MAVQTRKNTKKVRNKKITAQTSQFEAKSRPKTWLQSKNGV